MNGQPTIRTRRLTLRPFGIDDAKRVQQLAGDRAIASTTLNIPHPYEDGMAEDWIETHTELFEAGTQVVFAIELSIEASLIGAISLMHIDHMLEHAELGYWIGKPYWNQGYCTEAGHALFTYAFEKLGINRIFGYHFIRNPASGRVMSKLRMQYKGCLWRHVEKWGEYEDLAVYEIVRSDFFQSESSA